MCRSGFVDPDEYVMTPLSVKNTDTIVNVEDESSSMSGGDSGRRARVVPAPISTVAWNQTGTILSTSGQDVRLWRCMLCAAWVVRTHAQHIPPPPPFFQFFLFFSF